MTDLTTPGDKNPRRWLVLAKIDSPGTEAEGQLTLTPITLPPAKALPESRDITRAVGKVKFWPHR